MILSIILTLTAWLLAIKSQDLAYLINRLLDLELIWGLGLAMLVSLIFFILSYYLNRRGEKNQKVFLFNFLVGLFSSLYMVLIFIAWLG